MAHKSELNYRLVPFYILSTRSVLNPINQDLQSLGHAFFCLSFNYLEFTTKPVI